MNPGIHVAYAGARLAARLRPRNRTSAPLPAQPATPGLSVVIPSRNGKELLAAQLPGILHDLPPSAEVVVVDNGSEDGTAAWLKASFPYVRIESSSAPLSFARAVNQGLATVRHVRVCLLNNDMQIDPGFFQALEQAFDQVPRLFCATAQIRFPPGVRREETGKAVMAQHRPDDFPLRCDEPLPSEDLTYVLYGSGGCSLYDTARLRALGGLDTAYEPAYVEDLDLGFRAWQRGWPSVYVARARVEHRHRATTSRYYTAPQLEAIFEINYLKFLARSIYSAATFGRLWNAAIERLRLRASRDQSARSALRQAPRLALLGGPVSSPILSEESVLALTNGSVFVFPGRPSGGRPRVLVAATSPRPSVRSDRDEILVAFTDNPAALPAALQQAFIETVLVQQGDRSHLSFQAALQQTVRKWQPETVELETASLAAYREYCAPARAVLV